MAGLTGIAAGAPLVPLFQKPKRDLEGEHQDLENRELEARFFGALVKPLIAAASGLIKPKRELSDDLFLRDLNDVEARELEARFFGALVKPLIAAASGWIKPKRDLDGEHQDLEDRELEARFFGALVKPLIAAASGLIKPKRELSDDLFLRDLDGVEARELEARFFGALVKPLIAAASAWIKPKRELSDELFLREPEFENDGSSHDLDARVLPLPAITAGLAGLASLTPLIPSLVNRPKREISDDLFSREPEDWAQWAEAIHNQVAKREPEPQGPILTFPKLPKIFSFLP